MSSEACWHGVSVYHGAGQALLAWTSAESAAGTMRAWTVLTWVGENRTSNSKHRLGLGPPVFLPFANPGASVANGQSATDNCGECNRDAAADCHEDCHGVWCDSVLWSALYGTQFYSL